MICKTELRKTECALLFVEKERRLKKLTRVIMFGYNMCDFVATCVVVEKTQGEHELKNITSLGIRRRYINNF